MKPHDRAVKADNDVRDMQQALRRCTIGLARWCIDYAADASPLHSPSNEPGRGEAELTPTEAAADRSMQHVDKHLGHAIGYLSALKRWDVKAMDGHAGWLWNNVEHEQLADRCRRCGEKGDLRGGDCTRCRKSVERERNRVA